MISNIIGEGDTAYICAIPSNHNICYKLFKKDFYDYPTQEIINYEKFKSFLDMFSKFYPHHNLHLPRIVGRKNHILFMERIHGYNINTIIILKEILGRSADYDVNISDYTIQTEAFTLKKGDGEELYKEITSYYMSYFYNSSQIKDSGLFDFYRFMLEKNVRYADFTPKNIMIDSRGFVYIIDFGILKLNKTC